MRNAIVPQRTVLSWSDISPVKYTAFYYIVNIIHFELMTMHPLFQVFYYDR